MLHFGRMRNLQQLATDQSTVHNVFYEEPNIFRRGNFKLNRAAFLAGWHQLRGGRLLSVPGKTEAGSDLSDSTPSRSITLGLRRRFGAMFFSKPTNHHIPDVY